MPGALRQLTTRNDNLDSIELSAGPLSEQARDFHFAVTWVTLFTQLDPIEASGRRPKVDTPSPVLALVPVAPMPLAAPRPERDPNAGWEMTVPKMIRTEDGNFAPAESERGS
jgi:hypothetical protein